MLHTVVEASGTLGGAAGAAGAAGRIVLVHGFTQTLASWDPVVASLSPAFEIVRVDLPGHGGSADVRLGFDDTAAAIATAGGAGAIYVGYSMGGRLCLAAGLYHPTRGIVLVGASPGIAEADARTARAAADDILAVTIERDGTDAFLARWLAQPMFRTLQPTADDLRARHANTASGLAAALRALGPGVQPSLWHDLPSLAVPALFVAGELDTRYVELAHTMAELAGPLASTRILTGAGHAAHLEDPAAFAAILEAMRAG